MKKGWREHRDRLTPRHAALCEFTEKLTLRPSGMTPDDLAPLRAQGLDDGDVLEVVHVIGYFNHINRVADALGVDPEEFMR